MRVKITPSLAPNSDVEQHTGFERFKPFLVYVVPLVSIFGVVVGAMAAGFASEGAAIPKLWGRVRVSGQVIWAAQFKETRKTSGGGKAGKKRHDVIPSFARTLVAAAAQGCKSALWTSGDEPRLARFLDDVARRNGGLRCGQQAGQTLSRRPRGRARGTWWI